MHVLSNVGQQTHTLVQLTSKKSGVLDAPVMRKCMLHCRRRCRGKIWIPMTRVSQACQILLSLFQLWNKDEFFLFRPGESRNHFPQWQRQGFAYATNAKDFFPACCIWTQTEDDFLWLCSCWTNYTAFLPDVAAQGVFGLQSSVMAAVCNGDLNTLKCQGGRDARFWSVIFCAENPIELS